MGALPGASRRQLFKLAGLGTAALAAAGTHSLLTPAQAASPGEPDIGLASNADKPLSIVNLDDLEAEAKAALSPARFAFLGPSGDGWTYRQNRRAFNDYPIMPRRLQGISEQAIDLKTRLLDAELPFPIITAPMGGQGMIHVEADVAAAGGTGAAGALYVSSGAATKKMEDIAQATAAAKWFQIYMNKDAGINRWLCQRAKESGFSAIVLTADALGPGASDDYIRLGRPFPPALRVPGNHDPAQGGHGNFFDFKRDLGYGDIDFLREASGLPVVVKGLLSTEDVGRSLENGAAGIWVSNHGGRQMDGVPASVSVLRAAVDAAAGRAPIILDGGVRRGIDVFKALALGAACVAIGRPVLWGMAAGGAPGVKSVYAYLIAQLRSTMLLSGTQTIADINRQFVLMKA